MENLCIECKYSYLGELSEWVCEKNGCIIDSISEDGCAEYFESLFKPQE